MSSYFVLAMYFIASTFFAIALHGRHSVVVSGRTVNAYKLMFFTLPPIIVGFYFVALRPFDSGGDTAGYIRTFNQLGSVFSAVDVGRNIYGNTEVLFWPVQAVLKYFLDVRGWLIANYLIVVALTFIAYRKITKGTGVSPLIFSLVFLTFFAVYAGNAMRQSYAIPLGVLAFCYAYNKDYFRFGLFSALAMAFHWPAFIILLTPLAVRLPSRALWYFAIPLAALLCSVFVVNVIDIFISLTGFEWLIVKAGLYLKIGRVSHLGEIWTALNFWLCVLMYFVVYLSRRLGGQGLDVIVKYHMMFMSLMLFCVSFADISERYMVWIMYLMPLNIAVFVLAINLPVIIKNIIFLLVFIVLAFLVFTRESAVVTLGIQW